MERTRRKTVVKWRTVLAISTMRIEIAKRAQNNGVSLFTGFSGFSGKKIKERERDKGITRLLSAASTIGTVSSYS